VEGTRRVLHGAGEAGVRQAVHISSVAVYGNAPAPVTEDDFLGNTLRESDTYARTKREAEEVAAALHGHGGMEITILRPAALYGERDRWFTPRLVAQLEWGLVPLVGRGATRFPAVYAGNAAGAVELALEGKGCGEVFNLGEDHEVTLRFLYERFAGALGLEPRFVSIPASVARMGARVGGRLGLGVPGARDLSLARIVRLVSEDNPYSSEKARTRLGWSPSFSLEDSMARTGAWIREQKGWDRVD
jgi:nucleoside-diphosphate-sugar epimerase